jgi:formylmethanofuran dehydrogenase subunit E
MKWSEVDNSLEYAWEETRLLKEAIKNIHKEMTHIYGKVACTECGQAWPCSTIRVLNGDTDE